MLSQNDIMASWIDKETVQVSVVIHTYNHEAFIARAIEGALIQKTDFRFELIVHDDASTDSTPLIISRYVSRYPDIIQFIAQTENQMSQGRRPPCTTFPGSSGAFIAICEGDDFWIDPLKLQKQYEAMAKYPQSNLCVHGAYITKGERPEKVHWDFGPKEKVIDVSEVFRKRNQFAPTASYFIRKSGLGILPRWFYDDPDLPYGDFLIEAALGLSGIVALPEAMSVYRRGTIGSHTESTRVLKDGLFINRTSRMIKFIDKLADELGIEESLVVCKKDLIALDCCLHGLASESTKVFGFGLSLFSGKSPWWWCFKFLSINPLAFRTLGVAAAFLRNCR